MIFTLLACGLPPLPETGPPLPILPVEELAQVDLAAVIPTDVLLRPDGSILVLDGQEDRVLRIAPGGSTAEPWSDTRALGPAVRLAAAADGGVWAVDPGAGENAGAILHLDAQGKLDRGRIPVDAAGVPLHPVDVLEDADGLRVALRAGGIVRLAPEDDVARDEIRSGAEGAALRRVVDLVELPAGFAAVDTITPRIQLFDRAGKSTGAFGRSGLAAGRMTRPKAATAFGDGLLVADSMLGVVQAFELDGDLVGVLGSGDAALRFGHPTAVRAEGDKVVVLEARPAAVRVLRLSPLPPAPLPSLVRAELVTANEDLAANDGAVCLQCHDGLVRDGREVWDPDAGHHPVFMKPERALPAFFPLDERGQITCTTCHSAHGEVELEVAKAATEPRPEVARHLQGGGSSFLRLSKENDDLCVACHSTDAHRAGGTAVVPGQGGHLTGDALLTALARRAESDPGAKTDANCLSCHAMHGAGGEKITRDPGDGKTCLACHDEKGGPANHVTGRVPGHDLEKEKRGQHVLLARDGGVGCLSCHDLTQGGGRALLRRLGRGAVVCQDCHSDRKDLAKSPHNRLAAEVTCVACHDVHGGNPERQLLLIQANASEGDPKGCLTCHGPGGKALRRKGQNPGEVGHPVDGRKTDEGALTCMSCHEAHSADHVDADGCAKCHADQAKAAHGGHGKATCLDCHNPHAADARAKGASDAGSARCLACHGPDSKDEAAKILSAWKHPAPNFLPSGERWKPLAGLTLFAPDGSAVPEGDNGELGCQSCHYVHSGPDKLKKEGVRDTCRACHGEDTILLYQYYHQPKRRESAKEAAG